MYINATTAGIPDLNFRAAMEAEHTARFDSDEAFVTSNYRITTTPRREWLVVLRCDPAAADMREHRVIPRVADLMRLPLTADAALDEAEVASVVLYTGPMVIRPPPRRARRPAEAQTGRSPRGSRPHVRSRQA